MKYGEARWGDEQMQLICKSANGHDVFLDKYATNIGVHLIENPELLELVKEALAQSEVEGENVAIAVDMGRVIGVTNCIKTTDEDEIVFARRKGRASYSRFVKHRKSEETSTLAIILHKKPHGYNLWSAWCGKLVPTKPDESGRMKTVEGFWDSHALIYDPHIIEPGSESTTKPTAGQ